MAESPELSIGYYRVQAVLHNPFEGGTLQEIIEQLEACDYRCEAGPLRLNLAFQALQAKARFEQDTLEEEHELMPQVMIKIANQLLAVPAVAQPGDEVRVSIDGGKPRVVAVLRAGVEIWREPNTGNDHEQH